MQVQSGDHEPSSLMRRATSQGWRPPDGAGEGSVGIDAADGLDDAAAEGFIALLARGVRIVFEGILGGNGVRHGEVAPVHGR